MQQPPLEWKLFLQLLQVSMGCREALECIPTNEQWMAIYHQAERQLLEGIVYTALERLPREQQPKGDFPIAWFVQTEQIRQANLELNHYVEKVMHELDTDGMPAVLLKGQGIAQCYPDPLLRHPGDIDLWVNRSMNEIVDYAHRKGVKVTEEGFIHLSYYYFEQVLVELHFTPSFVLTPWRNRYLRRYDAAQFPRQAAHRTTLPGTTTPVAVPTPDFNIVFLILHLQRHFFFDGVALKQFVDIYYLLRHTHFTAEERQHVLHQFSRLGMKRFVRATMYVMHSIFGLEEEKLLLPPHQALGELLLTDIYYAGHFTANDLRRKRGETHWQRYWRMAARNIRMQPVETLVHPFYNLLSRPWTYLKLFMTDTVHATADEQRKC